MWNKAAHEEMACLNKLQYLQNYLKVDKIIHTNTNTMDSTNKQYTSKPLSKFEELKKKDATPIRCNFHHEHLYAFCPQGGSLVRLFTRKFLCMNLICCKYYLLNLNLCANIYI